MSDLIYRYIYIF